MVIIDQIHVFTGKSDDETLVSTARVLEESLRMPLDEIEIRFLKSRGLYIEQ